MLVMKRKHEEAVLVFCNGLRLVVKVISIGKNGVKLGFTGSRAGFTIRRAELVPPLSALVSRNCNGRKKKGHH